SGPIGRVTREDILKSKDVGSGAGATAASRPAMVMPPKMSFKGVGGALEERVSMRGIRKKIAENMQAAKHIVPHFTLMEEVNVTELVKVREQAKAAAEKQGVKVTYLPFIMKALIATIREFPMFNASIDDAASEIVYKKYFNLGFAADTPNGLLVPVIKDGDHKTVIELSREIIELSKKARDGKLALDEMKGATITITNIGSVGGVYATPIINHPEVAILGMYKISDKPVWKNNQWVPEKFMNFTITCDHRLIDGAVAANFMKSFASRVENPSQLILDMM
ncbi:MAG: 2-oxo acid dehydrogenase subunit E2, partial [Flavobacteriales bacterium]|nr:2-oxo acid dehydrogenase subunit E2 [Flavobacteriales bacterium]